jgi:hypothetical protein
MKKSAIICMILVIGLICSCEQQDAIKNVTALETAKTNFKRSEPAAFTFRSDALPDRIKWTVSPDKNVTITADGYTARILFNDAGRYQVIATDNRTTSRTFVDVDTLSYTPGDTTTIPTQPEPPVVNPIDTTTVIDTVGTNSVILSLEGDEFTLDPVSPDSLEGKGLIINVVNKNSYPCKNTQLYANGFYKSSSGDSFYVGPNSDYLVQPNGAYYFNISHAIKPAARYCQEGEKRFSFPLIVYPIPEGNSKIEVYLNGKTYAGNIRKEGSTFHINWPYTSGVKFSKLVVTK